MDPEIYNKSIEKIGGLVKEIDIEDIKSKLNSIEDTEINIDISKSASTLNKKLVNMIESCKYLVDTYSDFGKIKVKNKFVEKAKFWEEHKISQEDLVFRRQQINKEEFKRSYSKCENYINGFKEEKNKFSEIYRKTLSKL